MRIRMFNSRRLLMASLLLAMATSWMAGEKPTNLSIGVQSRNDLTAEELAAVLDAYVWKLDVSLPADVPRVWVHLEQRKKGHDKQGFGAGINTTVKPDTKRQLVIAIVPIGGGIFDAENVRVTIIGFGMQSSQVTENPLRKLAIGRTSSPEVNADGTFTLIGGYQGNTVASPVSNADLVIALKIEPERGPQLDSRPE